MDILKARKKAREAKEAREKRGTTGLPAPAEPEAPDHRTSPPVEVHEPTERHTQLPQAAPLHDDEHVARAPRAQRPARRDPLADFLATYDEGEVAGFLEATDTGLHEEEKRFLSFDLEGEAYAADIMDVREILKMFTLTEVPRAPHEVLGVLSKRGMVMPVVDLAAVLGLRGPSSDIDRDQRVLVTGDGDRVCGLRVDRVRQVVRLGQRAIEEVPPGLGTRNAHMLLGLGRARVEGHEAPQMLILLDVQAVLAHFSEAMGIEPDVPRTEGVR